MRTTVTGQGVRVVCDRAPHRGRTAPCVSCGRPFVVPPVAWMVWSGPELLSTWGDCCLNHLSRVRRLRVLTSVAGTEESDALCSVPEM